MKLSVGNKQMFCCDSVDDSTCRDDPVLLWLSVEVKSEGDRDLRRLVGLGSFSKSECSETQWRSKALSTSALTVPQRGTG